MATAAMASHALQPLLQQQQQSALAKPWRRQVELCRLAAGRVIIRSQEPVEIRSSQGGVGGGGLDGRYRRTNGAQKSRTSAQASVLGELRSDVVAEVEDLRLQEAGSATGEESSGASNCGLEEVVEGENDERDEESRAVDADVGSSLGDGAISAGALAKEVAKRRNFAIISHPDAGKTTLTEKLLLYGGAIHEAGAVKARRDARHATSDWMELEKQRGISITSTALVFESKGYQITLLDTPGHQDFGEDTYRTLAAADNAVMLVDAGKGLEPQTRKLFEVSNEIGILLPRVLEFLRAPF